MAHPPHSAANAENPLWKEELAAELFLRGQFGDASRLEFPGGTRSNWLPSQESVAKDLAEHVARLSLSRSTDESVMVVPASLQEKLYGAHAFPPPLRDVPSISSPHAIFAITTPKGDENTYTRELLRKEQLPTKNYTILEFSLPDCYNPYPSVWLPRWQCKQREELLRMIMDSDPMCEDCASVGMCCNKCMTMNHTPVQSAASYQFQSESGQAYNNGEITDSSMD
jgi:hypothetical protein